MEIAFLYLLVNSKVFLSAEYHEALRKYWQNIFKYIVKFAGEKSNVKASLQIRLLFHCVDLNCINLLSFNVHLYRLEVVFIKHLYKRYIFWLSKTNKS